MVTRLHDDTEGVVAALHRLGEDPEATDYWRRLTAGMAQRVLEGAVIEHRIRAVRPAPKGPSA